MKTAALTNLVILGLTTIVVAADGQQFDCPKPITAPDAWDDSNGNTYYDAEEPYDPSLTGFGFGDIGATLLLHMTATPGPIEWGQYYIIAYPPLGGTAPPDGDDEWTRKWLSECSPFTVVAGDSLQLVPGNLVSIVIEELSTLIALDPSAYWDEDSLIVRGSAYAKSPRLITVPAYDPRFGPVVTRNYLKVEKLLSLFVETVGPGSRVSTRIAATGLTSGTPIRITTWGAIKRSY